MKILLVEDTVGEPISKVIENWGHEVLLAEDATQARQVLESTSVDLMIVDWMLPGESGIDLVRALQSGGGAPAPVLMISGRMKPTDVVEAHDVGVDDYLAKPFSAAKLRAKIADVTQQWGQRRSLAPAIDRILEAGRLFREGEDAPVVVIAERASSKKTLLNAGHTVVSCLESFVDGVESVNESNPDLGLTFQLVDSSAEMIATVQKRVIRPRVGFLVISVEAGGTPVAAARMLAGRDDMPQLVVICDKPQDLGLKTWYALEKQGVILEGRSKLDAERWTQLLQEHVVDKASGEAG